MSHNQLQSEAMELAAPAAATGLRASLVGWLESERPRWFLWLPVWLGLGIASYFSLETEPSWVVALALAMAAFVLRVFVRGGVSGDFFVPMVLMIVIGFALAKARVGYVAAPVLETTLQRADVEGIVTLIEPRANRGDRITIKVVSIKDRDRVLERLPRYARIRTLQSTPGLKPGDHVKLRAKLGPPSLPSFPGDYDFARAAWFQQLGATGFAIRPAEVIKAAAPQTSGRFSSAIERLRQAIGQRIKAALPGENGAIATALITGERGGISEASTTAFRDSGLLHILSISGLHMVIMAGAAFVGVRMLLSTSPRLALYYPVKKWAAVVALLAGTGYLLISGSSVATLRSAIMVAILFFAILIDRPAIAMRNVALAALVLLFAMPETLLDAGFQMSFAAVICLVASYEAMRDRLGLDPDLEHAGGWFRKIGGFFGGIVLSTLIASVAVAPFAIYHFHQTQQYAVAANLLAIPVCNVIVMPAGLLTLIAMPFGLEAWPLWLMGRGIDMMMWAADAVAAVPGAVGRVAAVPRASLVVFAFGALWLTLWRTRWRLTGLLMCALGIALAPFHQRADLIVGREATLVAVRGADGLLYATPGHHGGFELERWLSQDGDGRDAALVSTALNTGSNTSPWRCDVAGCMARVNGLRIAALRHPSALTEDCDAVDVLVVAFVRPDVGCGRAKLVIDRRAVQRAGTHAIYVEAATLQHQMPKLEIVTVADGRGQRPWSVITKSQPGPKRAAPVTKSTTTDNSDE